MSAWEFETPAGHTVRIALAADGAAVSTRTVHGAVDGELFDLDVFEETVLPAMSASLSEEQLTSVLEALRDLRGRRDRDDDEIP